MENKRVINLMILLVDLIAIVISYAIALMVRYGTISDIWYARLNGTGLVILALEYIVVFYVFGNHERFLVRGLLEGLREVIKGNMILLGLFVVTFFMNRTIASYSRFMIGVFFIFNIAVSYLFRLYFKTFAFYYLKRNRYMKQLLVIALKRNVNQVLANLTDLNKIGYMISAVAVLDHDMTGKKVQGHKITLNNESLYDFMRINVVDEVFLSVPSYPIEELERMILEIESAGIPVNISINTFNLRVREKVVQQFAGDYVLTFSTKVFEPASLILKRLLDLIGGFIGLIFTAIVTLIIAPAIRIESPGPIFFSQIRIGKNGRQFKIYKFRSMYQDAEERKQELMSHNEMDGLMFKMTNDPRITKVGRFIRKTSIDELPQFLNVLRGDMSLVGTRPPTKDEFMQYATRHKRRLSLKPGLTGLWQVSGRSDINNFEEVVKLDLEYIDRWTFWLDIKLILKTIFVVFTGRGSK